MERLGIQHLRTIEYVHGFGTGIDLGVATVKRAMPLTLELGPVLDQLRYHSGGLGPFRRRPLREEVQRRRRRGIQGLLPKAKLQLDQLSRVTPCL